MLAKTVVNWGSVPDWIAAIGTVLAFAGFSIALIWEIRKRRYDDEQLAADRREAEAQQARLVFWTLLGGLSHETRVNVRNASDGPIFNVELRLNRADKSDSPRFVKTISGGFSVSEIEPHGETELRLKLPPWEESLSDGESVNLYLVFTDSVGRRWIRAEERQPRRYDEPGNHESRR
jgi:hypothetical protein